MFLKDYKRRIRKRIRIRKKIRGTAECPRLSVFKSLNHIYAQLIDDDKGNTLVHASTLSKEIKEEVKNIKGKIPKAKLVGKLLAQKAIEKGITTVVFDRSGYPYHGKVKAIAEGAREGGLKFWILLLQEIILAGSSNGRTAAFGAVCGGSNPPPAAVNFNFEIDEI